MFPRHFRVTGEPRACVLHKGKRGFGFVLRGAKAASPLMEMIPSDKCPGLQYMDDVDPGGVADMAGIVKGDFLLEVGYTFKSYSFKSHRDPSAHRWQLWSWTRSSATIILTPSNLAYL